MEKPRQVSILEHLSNVCPSPCPRFLTPEDTQSIDYVFGEVSSWWAASFSMGIMTMLRVWLSVDTPPEEETLVSFLCQGGSSSLKTPALLSRPLQTTLCLNGRSYVVAGQHPVEPYTQCVCYKLTKLTCLKT
ncbi:28S ribosomal protein S5, mitochondrial [Labeo rohita]|uniref:28S ribosomal protein S5, mitochondrial n=1 Tax=Labeo rohita TaxID=84645 RepID=A0ABQ8LZL5_LABRO|nr:28S ribosomal protein S5, mitochondrial [Labeo rohita]